MPLTDLPRLHRSIRPIALCVFRHEGKILVSDERDPLSGERFHRPLGGGIEYGESSHEAMAREAREELGAEVEDLVLLDVLENRFEYAGKFGHEVVFLFDGRFADPSLYAREVIHGSEQGTPIRAVWIDPERATAPLYPVGLRDALRQGAVPRS